MSTNSQKRRWLAFSRRYVTEARKIQDLVLPVSETLRSAVSVTAKIELLNSDTECRELKQLVTAHSRSLAVNIADDRALLAWLLKMSYCILIKAEA